MVNAFTVIALLRAAIRPSGVFANVWKGKFGKAFPALALRFIAAAAPEPRRALGKLARPDLNKG